MRASVFVFALFAVCASTAAIAPRENYGTWSIHVDLPVCHSTYGCNQNFEIEGRGDQTTGRPDVVFASCALGSGCTVEFSPIDGITYSIIHRADEARGQLVITQIFWDKTTEYRASGSIPFVGEPGDYQITITNLTSTLKKN